MQPETMEQSQPGLTTESSDRDKVAVSRSGSVLTRVLAPSNMGAVYLLVAIILIFGMWIPDLFLSTQTAKNIVNQYAITGIVALSLVLPLASGVFDLSVGAVMGFAGVLAAYFIGNNTDSWVVAVAMSLGLCAVIGAVNALIVVVLEIDSFIGTLATGSIITALTFGISGNLILFEDVVASGLTNLAQTSWHGIQLPFVYLVVLTIIIGLVLDRTTIGRYAYASGFNPDAARLSGVPTTRVRAGALISSSVLAGFAGILLTSRIGSADPGAGPSYLIPAFVAAFAGATQFRGGKFNSWGTIVAVMLLGTGTVGLSLAAAPSWAPQAFLGVALLTAVGLTVHSRRRR